MPSAAVTIDLPFPPSVNHYWVSRVIAPKGGRGKSFVQSAVGPRGRRFRQDVANIVVKQFGGNLRPTQQRIRATILAIMPDRRKRDVDNLLKATADALTHAGIWGDDNQLDDIRIIRGPVRPPGGLQVRIEAIAESETQGALFK